MPRPRNKIPKLYVDESRNRAFTKVDGKFITLGTANSPESQEAYGKLLASLARGETVEEAKAARDPQAKPKEFTLNELLLRFRTEELPRYSTDEQWCLKSVIRIARELFGATSMTDFGPLKLRIIRDGMIAKGWSRTTVNKHVMRLRMIIRWGVSWELVSQTIADSLSSVKSLQAGETDAPESRMRRAVSEQDLALVREKLCKPVYQDLFDLMLLCGARSGELLALTTSIIDRSGELWRAELVHHKTSHLGKSRTLFFNAKAQSVLMRYLSADPSKKIFDVTRATFGDAMKAACEVAFGMPAELRRRKLSPEDRVRARAWRRKHVITPHWLRHTVATRLADDVGTEAAQRLLGHATKAMTEHYSRAAEKQAQEAAKRLG